ncbi:hypothetical protein [Alicyclobacillus sp. SO9]|uniref:DUF456 domain-containing protein n=1 Tax=Alicyclobacillus sp. SO9 TaxID=2665646 RepID=UPI0018E84919|nr:hypothetical protein [Alicyclobacillus sp. SO9]
MISPQLTEQAFHNSIGTWTQNIKKAVPSENVQPILTTMQQTVDESKHSIAQAQVSLKELLGTTIIAKDAASGKVTVLALGPTTLTISRESHFHLKHASANNQNSLWSRLFGNDNHSLPPWLIFLISGLGIAGGLITNSRQRKREKRDWVEFGKKVDEYIDSIGKNGKMLNEYFSIDDLLKRIKNGNAKGTRRKLMKYLRRTRTLETLEKVSKIGGYVGDVVSVVPATIDAWKEIHSNDSAQTKTKVVLNDTGRAVGSVAGGIVGVSAGGEIGTVIGGILGTLIEPGGGTVVGAAAGDFIGSAVGSFVGGHYGAVIGGHLGNAVPWVQHHSVSLWKSVKHLF